MCRNDKEWYNDQAANLGSFFQNLYKVVDQVVAGQSSTICTIVKSCCNANSSPLSLNWILNCCFISYIFGTKWEYGIPLSSCSGNKFFFQALCWQKYYIPKVWPDQGSNLWPRDRDSTFHVTEAPALATRPSVTSRLKKLSRREMMHIANMALFDVFVGLYLLCIPAAYQQAYPGLVYG